MTPTLYVFSGLPGSGKTTLAKKLVKHLKAAYVRVDSVELGLHGGPEIEDMRIKCYKVAHAIAAENLRLGNSVVGDSVNPAAASREGWHNTAKSSGADVINIEVVCSNKVEHQHRLENRTTTLDGLIEPKWQEVLDREYHPWTDDRMHLETSGKDVEESFEELIEAISERGQRLL